MNATQVKATFEIDTMQAEEATNRVAASFNQMLLRAINAGAGLDQTSEKIKIQAKYLEVLKNELTALKNNEDANTGAVARKEIAVAKAELALKKLQDTQKNAALASMALAQNVDKTTESVNKVVEPVRAFDGALKKLEDFKKNTITDLKTGFINFGKASLDVAMQYESSLGMMQAVNKLTADDMAKVSQKAVELGGDLTLPATSAAGATNAMVQLSMAGLSLNDSLNAAKGTLQLSAAGHLAEADAAKINAAALNAFKLEGTQATRVADLFAASLKSSGTQITEVSEALNQAGAIYNAANVPIEDLVTQINLLGKAGIKGSDAGTSLKTMLQALQNPSTEAANAMQALGISVYNADGSMKNTRDIIEIFSTSISNLTQQQRDQTLATIFGSDATRAANIVFSDGVKAFDDMKKSVTENGVAAQLAEAQTKGLAGAFAGLQSQGETLAIKVLMPILPIFTSLLGYLAQGVGLITDNFIPAVGSLVAGMLLWELHTKATAIAGAGGLLPYTIAQATALKAMALSAISAVAPLIAITGMAAAFGLIVYAIVDFNKKLDEQAKTLLSNSKAYTEAEKALDRYKKSSDAVKLATSAEAQELERLEKLYKEKAERATGTGNFGNSLKAFFDSGDVTNKQIDELKALEKQINDVKQSLETGMNDAAFKNMNIDVAISDFNSLEAATDGYKVTAQEAFIVTNEAMEESAKVLEKLASEAPNAYNDLINTEVTFLSDSEQRKSDHNAKIIKLEADLKKATTKEKQDSIKEQISAENLAYTESEKTQALSYAKQQQAQRVHLGQMLIDYIKAKALTDEGFSSKAGELINFVANQYGIVTSAGDVAWGNNLNALNAYVDGGITSLDDLGKSFNENEKNAINTESRMRELEKTYVAKIELDYEKGLLNAQEYQEALNKTPQVVKTQFDAETQLAENNAKKLEDQALRVERSYKSDFVAETNTATSSVYTLSTTYDQVPASVVTNAQLNTSTALTDALNLGSNLMAGIAQGIAKSVNAANIAMANAVASVIQTGKNTGRIKSPSGVTDEETGQPLMEGVALGIKKAEDKPKKAMSEAIGKIVNAYKEHKSKVEELNSKHAEKLEKIWSDYYSKHKEQLDKFNGDKFDKQLGFYNSIADLDSVARDRAYKKQTEAWDKSQELAKTKGGAIADQYYQTATAQIEADEQRASKITSVEEEIANKRKELLEETDSARQASLAKEIAELESRKQFLSDVDAQQDKRDAEKLAAIESQQEKIAVERDEALDKENKDYTEAAQKLEDQFKTTIEKLNGKLETVIAAHDPLREAFQKTSDKIVENMNNIANAVNKAAGSGTNESESGENSPEPRAKGGNVYAGETYLVAEEKPELFVPNIDGFIANDEQIAKAAKRAGMLNNNNAQSNKNDQPVTITHVWNIQNNIDYQRLAMEVKKIERDKSR